MSDEQIVLPKKKISATSKSPKRMLIFSKPKTGKTSLLAELPNSLLLDLEDGSDFLDAVKIKIDSVDRLKEVGEAIKKEGKPYKYIIVDTVTRLEDLSVSLALKIYKATPMGSKYDGTDVRTLPNGAGYSYLREAFFKLTDYIETLADRTIYLGHLKSKFIEKNGKEVQAVEVDLTGKIKSMLSANVDAIGLLYRSKHNENILSFKTNDDVICGARPEHLKNQEIVVSEVNEKNKFITHWDKIYID